MANQELYEDAVRRLAKCGYEVLADDQGYIVRHFSDTKDVSRMRNLDELIEQADLMEWAQQRQRTVN
jgi:hypothetical protein